MPPDSDSCDPTYPRPKSRGDDGQRHRYAPLWLPKPAWLPTSSGPREIGLRPHRVAANGFVEEFDSESLCATKKKPKGISARQWRR